MLVRYLLVKYKSSRNVSALIKMGEIKLDGYLCDRCDHTWISRGIVTRPVVCPRCKSPYWDVPRRNGIKKLSRASASGPAELKGSVKVPKVGNELFPFKNSGVGNG